MVVTVLSRGVGPIVIVMIIALDRRMVIVTICRFLLLVIVLMVSRFLLLVIVLMVSRFLLLMLVLMLLREQGRRHRGAQGKRRHGENDRLPSMLVHGLSSDVVRGGGDYGYPRSSRNSSLHCFDVSGRLRT
jgi:hypothetical protein